MIVLLSALGTITYFTFKDTISTSKKRIAELTLQNHILGFNDLVEELQHDVSETLFASDIGFSHHTVADITETLQSRAEADPFLSSVVLVIADQVISPVQSQQSRELQASLPASLSGLKHGLLMTANTLWIRSPLPETMGPDMAAFFSLDQEHVWETILHENSREMGTLFFVTSQNAVIVSHLESADHFTDAETHAGTAHHQSSRHQDATDHHESHDRHDAREGHESVEHADEHDAVENHDPADHDEAHDEHDASDAHVPEEQADLQAQTATDSHPGAANDGHAHDSNDTVDTPLSRLAADSDRLMALSHEISHYGTELTHIGGNYVVANELGLINWQVHSVIPEKTFIADLIKLRNRIITATALTFWISLWIVLIVAHRISRPLISLSAATRDIQQHNYSTPLDFVRRRDEIGDLASSFETMRRDIEQLIYNDSLTGVFNRRYLLKTLNLQIAEAMESGQPASFIMVDLDHFKAINDTHGHMAGDAMLKAAAKAIVAAVGDIGIVARYGGEEFCVLLPDTAARQANVVAERIRMDMESLEIVFGELALSVTCSLGVADIDSIDNARQLKWDHVVHLLITHADQALYHAKDAGRNQSVLISPELLIGKAA